MDITPEAWQKLSVLLDEALDLTDAERVPFLDRLRGQDPRMCQQVESLLAQQSPNSLLEKLPSQAVQDLSNVTESAKTEIAKQTGAMRIAKILGAGGSPRESHESVLVDFLAPAQDADEIGRLGKYRILGILGRGGMGVVFHAEDPMLKRIVALKAILPSLCAGEAVRKRFLREARAMARLDHENIVRLYDVNEVQGVPYIAMEYLAGETLDARLHREPVLPLAETLRIGREVAAGLAAAHGQELIHRDIKPANIFLAGDTRRVKILDFGITRAQEEETRLTPSGDILGTPSHMAPEQARGEKVDSRCDLFSLGVVLYRMSTGVAPFAAADPLKTIKAIATMTPPAPHLQNAQVPAELSGLIMKLLEKDPAKRCVSAQEVVETLASIERGEPAPKPPSAGPIRPHAPAGRFPWLIVLAVLAACVFIGVPLVVAVLHFLQ